MNVNALQLHNKSRLDDSDLDHQVLEVAVNPYNRINVINDIDDFFSLRDSWNEINDNSVKGTVFSSWEWMYTWWETYCNQGSRNLYILCCSNIDNEILGIAPFQITYNPKRYFPCNRQLIMLGTGETDGTNVFGEYSDLVIKKGHETAVISAMSDFLFNQQSLWDGIKFHQQLVDSQVSKLFDNSNNPNLKIKKTIIGDGCRTYIDLPDSYQNYLMSLRKKMRNNITRNYSRIKKEQDFLITSVTVESEVEAQITNKETAIEILAMLNRSRRGHLNKKSVFEAPRFLLFHQRLLKRLIPLNKVSLRILRFGEEPVAALYSFVDKETIHAYQSGFETEKGHRYSLLTTMLSQEISHSIDNQQLSRFNFMYSADENTYKRRYAGVTEKMFNISYDKEGIKYLIYHFIHIVMKSSIKKMLKIN